LYQLDKETQSRKGGLEFYQFNPESPNLSLISDFATDSGVFRIKWIRRKGSPCIFCVLTDGTLLCIPPNPSKHGIYSNPEQFRVTDSMLTSLAMFKDTDPDRVLCGDAVGTLYLYDLECNSVVKSWKAHKFGNLPTEIWTVAWDNENENMVYSGADDAQIKGWDLRSSGGPVFSNMGHNAGVTYLLSNSSTSNEMVSGSYDELVRLWDLRSMAEPVSELDAGGGVWDMDWHPTKKNVIAAACMYGGWRVAEIGEEKKWNEVGGVKKRMEGLLYGVSWARFDDSLLAVCSFYDRCIALYKV